MLTESGEQEVASTQNTIVRHINQRMKIKSMEVQEFTTLVVSIVSSKEREIGYSCTLSTKKRKQLESFIFACICSLI